MSNQILNQTIQQFSAAHPALTTIVLFAVCVGIALLFDRAFQHPPRGLSYDPGPTDEEVEKTRRLMNAAARGDFQCSDRDLSTVVVPFRRAAVVRTADAIADRAVSRVADDALVGNGRLPHADWSRRSRS